MNYVSKSRYKSFENFKLRISLVSRIFIYKNNVNITCSLHGLTNSLMNYRTNQPSLDYRDRG